MNPVFLAILARRKKKSSSAGQKRARHSRCNKPTYEFRPPAEPECRHEPIWSPVSVNLRDDYGERVSRKICYLAELAILPRLANEASGLYYVDDGRSIPTAESCLSPPQSDETDDEVWEDDEEEDDNDD